MEKYNRTLNVLFQYHKSLMLKHQMEHIDSLSSIISDLDEDIKKKQNP